MRALLAHAGAAGMLLVGCAMPQTASEPASVGLAELLERPAERALFDAMRAYDDAQYAQADAALQRALGNGLRSAGDRATAHKLLAFISCAQQRLAQCEAAFRAARAADPRFTLSRSEAGHPVWGPVYQRVVGR